jgi:excisionase family DNA binding protein
MSERLLTTREVATFLGVSPETVLRRWRAGELPGYRLASNVLRFRESEIEEWLEGTRPERPLVSVPQGSYDRGRG